MKSLEFQLNQALDLVKQRDGEIVSLKAAVTEWRVKWAFEVRDRQLSTSRLPEPCVKRLHEAFAKSTDNAGLKQAINCELRNLERVR